MPLSAPLSAFKRPLVALKRPLSAFKGSDSWVFKVLPEERRKNLNLPARPSQPAMARLEPRCPMAMFNGVHLDVVGLEFRFLESNTGRVPNARICFGIGPERALALFGRASASSHGLS